jgi:hypothetical protein
MGLIILPIAAAITVMGACISSLFGFFLTSLAIMATSLTGLIALVLLI